MLCCLRSSMLERIGRAGRSSQNREVSSGGQAEMVLVDCLSGTQVTTLGDQATLQPEERSVRCSGNDCIAS